MVSDTPPDAWSPIFEVSGRDSELDETEPVAEHSSKKVLLRGESGDTVQVTAVHEGMHRIPERFEIARRTNTYHGPVLNLRSDIDEHGWELDCPGRYSHPILWRAVCDEKGYVYSWSKIAKVTVEIADVAGYDICEECREPIRTPMHRSLAMLGQCPGENTLSGNVGGDDGV